MTETEESHRSRPARAEASGGSAAKRASEPEHIDLDLPAEPSVLSLVRLTVGVVAARADLGLEDVDDLRLAVEELFLSLWRAAVRKPERLLFGFIWDDRAVEVRCTFMLGDAAADREPPPPIDAGDEYGSMAGLPAELSQQILEALVEEHGVDTSGANATGWVRKARAAAVQ
jgi:hypothetical protein